MRRRGLSILLFLFMILVLAGCGASGNKETEADYRQQAIDLMEIGRYQEAAEMFQIALNQSYGTLDDMDLDIAYYRAAALYNAGETGDAIDAYTAMIAYDKKAWEPYYLRATIYLNEGSKESADADYAEAIAKDKKNYDLYIQIYQNLNSAGYGEEGEQYLNRALELAGNGAAGLCAKGQISYYLGDTNQALSYLQQAIDAGSEKARLELIGIYEEEKEYDKAFSQIEAGLQAEDETYYQELSRVQIVLYEKEGEWDKAKTAMASYLENYPNDKEASRENTFLQTR